MFQMNKEEDVRPKCYFTSSILPAHVDQDQIPSKKRPFTAISSRNSYHSINLLFADNKAEEFKQRISDASCRLHYARVYMKLGDLIKGDFFNEYIKTGNILMLSEGRPGLDRVFSLQEGVLRLEVDKPTYERLGLEGSVIASEGRKHIKSRYAIELNLRLPSMVRGKKGFERIVRAFENVLNDSLAWLFYDLKGPNDGSGPISAYQPQINKVEPEVQRLPGVIVPELDVNFVSEEYEEAADLLEWITMALHASPRLFSHDRIDPYLSRYSVPTSAKARDSDTRAVGQDLVKFRWHGFMPSNFVMTILLRALTSFGEDWFAMDAASFDGNNCVLLQKQRETAMWEYAD